MLKQLYEKFQHWSSKGSVWLYSDPHFNDKDCLKIDPRWPSPEEQITKINAKVHKNDTLIILGDIGDVSYIPKIKANYKVLITGNHDLGASNYKRKKIQCIYNAEDYGDSEKKLRAELRKEFPTEDILISRSYDFYSPFVHCNVTIDNRMFDEVYEGPLFIGKKILLSHEPVDLPFALNIHGHNHEALGKLSKDRSKFNVCSNCINYEPQNLNEIIKAGYLKEIKTIHQLAIDRAKNSIHSKNLLN